MIASLYSVGLSLMARAPFPGCITAGVLLVRLGREMDPDDASNDRAWDAMQAILAGHRARDDARRR